MGRLMTASRPIARSLSAAVMSGAASVGLLSNFFSQSDGQANRVDVPFGSAEFWMYAAICMFLVVFAGLMSGLTLGLMSLDLVDLAVLKQGGTPQEQAYAAKIYPVVKKQHQLLVTLLLCNAAAMEALPLFLDKMVHPVMAVILSVTFVLLFGEVFPQAVCAHHGLAIGASMVWLVKLLMIMCYVVAYPLGKVHIWMEGMLTQHFPECTKPQLLVLDWMLGHGKSALFRRAQLKALVSIHSREAGQGGELTHDETTIISGALDLTGKIVKQAMTPIESLFSLDVNSRLDREVMNQIMRRGHSRIPVYSGSPKNIIGLLLIKNLLLVNLDEGTPVSAVAIRRMPRVYEDVPLYDMLNEFQKGGSHMAVVVSKMPMRSIVDADIGKRVREAMEASMTPKDDKDGSQTWNKLMELKRPPSENRDRKWVVESWEDNEDVVGIITLEDVIEELLQEEIVDETDEYVDVHRKIRVSMMAAIDRSSDPAEYNGQTKLDRQESSSSAFGVNVDNGRTSSSGNDGESEEEVGSNGNGEVDTRMRSGTVHYRDDTDCPMIHFEDDPHLGNNREGEGNGYSTGKPNGDSDASRNNLFWTGGASRRSDLSEPLLGGEDQVPSGR